MSAAHLRKTVLSAALLSLGLAVGASAQTPSTGTSAKTNATSTNATTSANASRGASDAKLEHRDKKFVEDAAKGGLAEVQFGQLAAQKAQSSEVKQFGQKMVDDHSKANDKLKQVASGKGIDLPTDLDRSAKREYDKLSKMNGDDFDREYMKHMVSDHKKDVKDFADEAKSGKDADVKSFASETLPTLQQHLQLAQQADAAVHASHGSSTMPTSGPAPGQPGSTMGKTGGTGGTTPSSNTKPPKS